MPGDEDRRIVLTSDPGAPDTSVPASDGVEGGDTIAWTIEHLDGPITDEAIADRARMRTRRFTDAYGTTPTSYRRRLAAPSDR